MKLHLSTSNDTYQINKVDTKSVTINQKIYSNSVIVMPDSLTDWEPTNVDNLKIAHFEILVKLEPELIILGTGQTIHFPSAELLSPLIQKGIGIEIMDTAAACRTYTILASEGRKVAAALLI
jgi:uncharacterized protein